MDPKDLHILSLLQDDARLTIRELAKKTAMRPSTVHQRILKLIATKVIEKFTVKLNCKAVGEGFVAFILVKGEPSEYLDAKVMNDPHVKEVFGITGEYDLLLKLRFKDVEEFNHFLITFRREQKKVRATLTMVGTATIKEL